MKRLQYDPLILEYNPVESPLLDFKSECILSAKKIASKNIENRPIALAMSGGVDSELMAQSFLEAGIPFFAAIGRYTTAVGDFVNKHDFVYAEDWCKAHSVDLIYVDLDIYNQASLLCEYALSARGFSPQYACHMYIFKWCSDNGYFFVASNGEFRLMLRGNQYVTGHTQIVMALNNFCQLHALKGETHFLRQDARMVLSFLELPTTKRLMSERYHDIHPHRYECYNDVFNFVTRPKYTGFEHVQEWDARLRNPMKLVMGKYNKMVYTSLDYLKSLLGK